MSVDMVLLAVNVVGIGFGFANIVNKPSAIRALLLFGHVCFAGYYLGKLTS